MHLLTIAVLGLKGGTGKTTIAVNLAAAFHLAGSRTLILDADRQGSAFEWFSARADGGPLDGLNVLRADRPLSPAKFREATAGYEVAVIDGPPRLGDVTRAAAVAATVVVLPLRPGAFDVWTVGEALSLLDEADALRAELGRPPLRRLLVLNAVPARGRVTHYALDAVNGAAELGPTIGSRVEFATAAAEGSSVLLTAPDSPAAAEIRAIFEKVMEGLR